MQGIGWRSSSQSYFWGGFKVVADIFFPLVKLPWCKPACCLPAVRAGHGAIPLSQVEQCVWPVDTGSERRPTTAEQLRGKGVFPKFHQLRQLVVSVCCWKDSGLARFVGWCLARVMCPALPALFSHSCSSIRVRTSHILVVWRYWGICLGWDWRADLGNCSSGKELGENL